MPVKKLILFFWTLGLLSAHSAETVDFSTCKVQTLGQTPTSVKEAFKGRVLILDFWASWCSPCKESLPFYEELNKRYGSQGLQILAVSVDDEVTDASEFVANKKFSFQFLWDKNRELSKRLKLQAVPTTLILDRNGKVLYREQGFVKSTKVKIEQELSKALK
jgi:thiol-disulfide isomerase/thioredoxin